jgi:hypothetical protein
VEPLFIKLTHDVEEKGFSVVGQGLMVQEELREVAEVLTVDLLSLAINFKHTYLRVSVDLISRGVPLLAPGRVPAQFLPVSVVVETELTDEEGVDVVISSRVGAVVPGIASVLAELDEVDGPYFGCIVMVLYVLLIHAVLIVLQEVLLCVSPLLLLLDLLELLQLSQALFIVSDDLVLEFPLVESPVLRVEMDVVLNIAHGNLRVFHFTHFNNLGQMRLLV